MMNLRSNQLAIGGVGLAAVLLVMGSPVYGQTDTTDETDRALTAFAANLRGANQIRFQVGLTARSVGQNNAEPLANSTFDVTAERPNILRIEPALGSNVSLISNGKTLVISGTDGKGDLNEAAPPTFDGFRKLMPKSLGPVELQTFSTVASLLSNNPAGFVAGEATDRSKYATFMLDGQAGEMFRFVHGKTETLVGLTANARPELVRLTTDTNTEVESGVVVNFTFRNWVLGRRTVTSEKAGDGEEKKTGEGSSATTNRPRRSVGIKIEDAPAKPK